MTVQENAGRGDEVVGFVALMLLGRAALTFVFDLFSLARDFSVGKLADTLLDLVVGVAVSLLLLWLLVRLRAWKRRRTQS
ncbi:hypothetical protein [Streptomyces griseorubiginosus]|uniref:hypothetical protein n=1 Tax=Streptomyces griseorubiginosus TaxID=67304 RepID=UPI0036252BE1